jgi:hypothetical protein
MAAGSHDIGTLEVNLGFNTSGAKAAERALIEVDQKAKTVNNSMKTQKGIITEIEERLVTLSTAQKNAFKYEDIVKYNRKIAETKMYLKEYQNAGLTAAQVVTKETGALGKMMNGLSSTMVSLGAAMLAAFSVRAIIRYTVEAVKLAAVAEGIKNSFMKMEGASIVIEDMRKATRGMIEESDLMKLGTVATNLKIPLQDVSKYLEFATKRAITTGGAVGHLSEIMVRGIGRKSSKAMIGFAR